MLENDQTEKMKVETERIRGGNPSPQKKLIQHKAKYEKSRQESEQKMKKGRTE